MNNTSSFVPTLMGIIIAGAAIWLFYGVFFPTPQRVPIDNALVTRVGSVAYFAGGCFWSMESAFEHVPGVNEAVSGYAGGSLKNPTYDDVNTETTGHRETIEVWYDPSKVSYRELVEYYFTVTDPVDAGGQFVDRGESYTSAIFYQTPEEESVVKDELRKLSASGAYISPIMTTALRFTNFYPAEDYHQDFAKKNPSRYALYRSGSGRNKRIGELCSLRAQKGLSCAIPTAVTTPSPVETQN